MGKSSKTFSVVLRLWGVQVLLIIISILFMGSFGGMLESSIGRKVYSVVTAFIYLGTYYSRVWNAGRKDVKNMVIYNNHHENQIRIKQTKSIIIGLLAAIPNIAALAVYIWASATGSSIAGAANSIFRFLQSAFVGLFGVDTPYTSNLPMYIIVTVLPIITSIPAYFAGTKDFSVTERYLPMLIYKKEDGNKNK